MNRNLASPFTFREAVMIDQMRRGLIPLEFPVTTLRRAALVCATASAINHSEACR